MIDEDNGVYNLIAAILSDSRSKEQVLQRCLATARNLYVEQSRFTDQGALTDSVTHLVFKAPNATYDFERLRRIQHVRMHFVFAVRDVRDVVCSMQRLVHIPMVENQVKRIARYRQLKRRYAADLKLIKNSDTPDHLRRAIVWKIKSGLYSELTREPLKAFLVHYEYLVAAPNYWILRMLDHVDLDTHSDSTLHHADVFQELGPGFTFEHGRSIRPHSIAGRDN